MAPSGAYFDRSIESARKELLSETDYLREAENQRIFRENLLAGDPDFYIPRIFKEFSTGTVFTSEFIKGVPIDQLADMSQETRNWVYRKFLRIFS